MTVHKQSIIVYNQVAYLTVLYSRLKSKNTTLPAKARSQSYGFSSSHRCECWTIKKVGHWRIGAFKLWCWRRLESPLDSKEIKPVNPKGNQSWIFIRKTDTDTETETPILWLPDMKSPLIWKEYGSGKDWRQEEKGVTEDEMVGWHLWLSGHEFEQNPGDGEGQEA